MDLPVFNGQATGPQGIGSLAIDLPPEEAPDVQKVISDEAGALAARLGLVESPQPEVQATPSSQPQAEAPAQPASDADMADRIRKVREKYGDLDQLAKAYVHTDQARRKAQTDRSGEISDLKQTVENMRAEMAAFLTPRPSHPNMIDLLPQATGIAPPAGDAEEFWKNPAANITSIVQSTVQQNLLAYEQAKQQQAHAERAQKFMDDKRSEMDAYRPLMIEIYQRRRGTFDKLPVEEAADLLLEQAKATAASLKAAQFYNEISGLEGKPGGQPVQAAPGAAGLPSGGTSARSQQQAPASWSDTAAAKRLMRSRGESTDETRALLDVLAERGFGDHVKIE